MHWTFQCYTVNVKLTRVFICTMHINLNIYFRCKLITVYCVATVHTPIRNYNVFALSIFVSFIILSMLIKNGPHSLIIHALHLIYISFILSLMLIKDGPHSLIIHALWCRNGDLHLYLSLYNHDGMLCCAINPW